MRSHTFRVVYDNGHTDARTVQKQNAFGGEGIKMVTSWLVTHLHTLRGIMEDLKLGLPSGADTADTW